VSVTLRAGAATDVGRARNINQDSFVLLPDRGLFIVADGMGGHNAGEVASALAAKSLHDFLTRADAANEATLAEALCLANDQVLTAAAADSTYEGMGTTVVAACISDGTVVFGSVGDSRIYRMTGGALEQLTDDDSWVSRVLPAHAIGSEEASRHPMRHVLTKVVGLRDDLEPTVGSSPFGTGDTLLLCSDGLHGVVNDSAIAALLGRSDSVEKIASELVEQALSAGSTDNITAVVVRRSG
jgi:protein phosphatase